MATHRCRFLCLDFAQTILTLVFCTRRFLPVRDCAGLFALPEIFVFSCWANQVAVGFLDRLAPLRRVPSRIPPSDQTSSCDRANLVALFVQTLRRNILLHSVWNQVTNRLFRGDPLSNHGRGDVNQRQIQEDKALGKFGG